MDSFQSSLSYFSTTVASAPTVHQRCLRALTLVGCSWNLIGAAILGYCLFFHDASPVDARLRFVGIGALMIAAGIFSVVIPLSRILREEHHSLTAGKVHPAA